MADRSLIAWLKAPPEITERLVPKQGDRPKRRAKLIEKANKVRAKQTINCSKLTVEELRSKRKQSEDEEIARLREKARSKQRARLSAIRKAESEIISQQYKKSKERRDRIGNKTKRKESMEEKERMRDFRERPKEIKKKNGSVGMVTIAPGAQQNKGEKQQGLHQSPEHVVKGHIHSNSTYQGSSMVANSNQPAIYQYQMNPYQQLQVPYQGPKRVLTKLYPKICISKVESPSSFIPTGRALYTRKLSSHSATICSTAECIQCATTSVAAATKSFSSAGKAVN